MFIILYRLFGTLEQIYPKNNSSILITRGRRVISIVIRKLCVFCFNLTFGNHDYYENYLPAQTLNIMHQLQI